MIIPKPGNLYISDLVIIYTGLSSGLGITGSDIISKELRSKLSESFYKRCRNCPEISNNTAHWLFPPCIQCNV